jgi:uncharacterized membrane protein
MVGSCLELEVLKVANTVKIVVTLVVLSILAVEDYKTRELDARLVYAFLGFSIAALVADLILCALPLWAKLFYVVFSIIPLGGLFGFLYKSGLSGDGDFYIALALGAAFASPEVYTVTLAKWGLIPPALAIVLYSSFVAIVFSLINALMVLAKYKGVLRTLPIKYRFIIPLLGRPIKISDYIGRSYAHYYLLQRFKVEENRLVVEWKLLTRLDNAGDEVKRLVEEGVLDPSMYIWATPGLPFIVYFLAGFLLLLVLGDYPITALVLRLLRT